MRERIQSRACAYPCTDTRWTVLLLSLLLALFLAWPSVAQQQPDVTKPAEPEDFSEELTTSDVPDSQVEKITIDGEGTVEVLDVEDTSTNIAPAPEAPAAPSDAPTVIEMPKDVPITVEPEPAHAPANEDLTWDERVTRDLESLLRQDPQIGAETVNVDSTEGTIRLSGTVATLGAKNRAGQLARMMRGVQQVENELVVTPSELDDSTVRQYVEAALRQEPIVDRDAIAVEVSHGQVALSGSVNSWQEKQLVEEIASQTRGVVTVDNQLSVGVAQAEAGSDEEIANQVRQRLRSDPWVSAENVEVTVNDGKVDLTGMVHSIAQRERAFASAWVRGVQSVDTSDLRIVPLTEAGAVPAPEQPDVAATPPVAPMTNEEVQAAVLSSLSYSPRLREFEPRVSVDNGVVVLEGTARTVRERLIAEQLAREVRGVYSVENNIEVSTEREFTDTELASQVRDAIDQHPDLSRLDVAVTVMKGVAYLSGNMTSPALQRQVQELAATVPGITKIVNETNLAEGVARKTDFEIKQDIETALYWSPLVDLDTIDVSVTQGIATLDGTVQRWASRLAAEDVAQQVGAVQVNNRLRVIEGPVELQAQGQQQVTVPIDSNDQIIIRK